MAVTYFYFQFSLKELTPEERAKFPGEFVKLEDGVVSYYWKGPENGNIVVLVHGLSTPKFVWDGNVDALVGAGKRVLVYDHLGRGFSDRPDIVYDGELYIRELSNLLEALHVTQCTIFLKSTKKWADWGFPHLLSGGPMMTLSPLRTPKRFK